MQSGTAALRLWRVSVVAAVLAFGMVSLSASATGHEEPLPPITESTLDEVERYLERRLSEVGRPGMAAAIVHDGEVVSTFELGDASPGTPMTADTPLFVASLSKSITAMALMQQVEAGRVDLDHPVAVYLPELAPEGDQVTVRDLLHHRSGLTTYVGNESWSGRSGASLEANVGRLGSHLRANAPFRYSNANYDALALIVQRVSGIQFDDYIADEVFAPLGMDDSFVGPSEARTDVADGHYHWLFFGYRRFDQPSPPGMAGSATMFSTAEDLAHFTIAHLQDGAYEGNRIVSDASIEQLHAPESLGIDLPEDYPAEVGYAGGLFVDASFDPEVDESLARMVTLFHGGSGLGYRAMIWIIPQVDLGFVALVNGNNVADETWLPQVAQGAKHLLFGLDPPDIEVRSPFLMRYGKQLLLALVAVQLVLAIVTIRTFRGRGRRWFNIAVLTLVSVVDLAALALIIWVIPTTAEAPHRVALQAPDYRILVAAATAGVFWGGYRTYMLVKRRQPARSASD